MCEMKNARYRNRMIAAAALLLSAGGVAHAVAPSAPRARVQSSVRVAQAVFHQGKLTHGGPVVYRNAGTDMDGREDDGPPDPADLPSVGLFARIPSDHRLQVLKLSAAPRGESGELQLLVDRREIGDPITLSSGHSGTYDVDLGGIPGAGTRRIELRVGAESGDITIQAINIFARRVGTPPAQGAETTGLEELDARPYLPLVKGTTWRYVHPEEEDERVDVRVAGKTSHAGADVTRIEEVDSDGFHLVDGLEGRWLIAYKAPGEALRRFERVPLPFFPADATIVGDRYEAIFRPSVSDLPPELRWEVQVSRSPEVEVPAGTFEDVLKLEVTARDLKKNRRTSDAEYLIADGVGIVKSRGMMFEQPIDRDLLSYKIGDGLGEDPDPEPEDPDPEPPSSPPPAPQPPRHQTDLPQVRALIDSWLTSKGLDPFGRKIGPAEGGIIRANYNPDTDGRPRHRYVWDHFWNKGLNAYVQAGLRGRTGGATPER